MGSVSGGGGPGVEEGRGEPAPYEGDRSNQGGEGVEAGGKEGGEGLLHRKFLQTECTHFLKPHLSC